MPKEDSELFEKAEIHRVIGVCSRMLVSSQQLQASRKFEFIETAKKMFPEGATEEEVSFRINKLLREEFLQ